MPTWAIYALITGGAVTLGGFGLWLLYRAGKAAGEAGQQAAVAQDAARIERAQSEILQQEVTRDDVAKNLDNDTF